VADDAASRQARAEWHEARLREVVAANVELSAALEKAEADNRELWVLLEQVTGELATVKQMVFGDSSEKSLRGGMPDAGPDSGYESRHGEKRRGQRAGAPGPRRRDFLIYRPSTSSTTSARTSAAAPAAAAGSPRSGSRLSTARLWWFWHKVRDLLGVRSSVVPAAGGGRSWLGRTSAA
jgi:hypothetical protein